MSPVWTTPPNTYPPAPEGLHQAVAVDVVDLGKVDTGFGLKPMIQITWELPHVINPETKRPFTVSARYNNSVDPRATLRKHLKAWRGRDFTPDEVKRFDIEKVLGANCQLDIVHNVKDDGRVFANVAAIVRLGQGQEPLAPSGNYVRKKDRPTSHEPIPTGAPTSEPPVDDSDIPF